MALFHKLLALLLEAVDLQLQSIKQGLKLILPAQQAVYIIHRVLHREREREMCVREVSLSLIT